MRQLLLIINVIVKPHTLPEECVRGRENERCQGRKEKKGTMKMGLIRAQLYYATYGEGDTQPNQFNQLNSCLLDDIIKKFSRTYWYV